MDSREPNGPDGADRTAAVSLDIGEVVAARLDDLLREFAEDAGLETVLVVDRSGALVSGVSAEAEVTVEVISALVAGASGAMRALVARIGETGAVESLHLGGNRLIYLKEVARDFILVAVAESSRPAGLVREKARDIDAELAEVLREVRPLDPPPDDLAFVETPSLRGIADDRSARIDFPDEESEQGDEEEPLTVESEDPAFDDKEETPLGSVFEVADEEDEEEVDFLGDEEDFVEAVDGKVELEEDLESVGEPDLEIASTLKPEIEAEPVVEPRGILEPLDIDDLEIVIEPTTSLSRNPGVAVPPLDSPFETDEEDEEDEEKPEGEGDEMLLPIEAVVESVFEPERGEPEDDFDSEVEHDFAASLSPDPPRSLFELEDEAEDTGNVFELDDEEDWDGEFGGWDEVEAHPGAEAASLFPPAGSPEPPVPPEPSGDAVASGESDEESAKDITREIDEMIAEEEEESEVRSSGPFYF